MHLEKLHIFGRHSTSCLCFSKEYGIEGYSHCLNHYLGVREGIQGFSLTYLLLTEQERVRVYQRASPPSSPLSLSGQNLYICE